MPYSAVLPIAAICLTFYFIFMTTVSPRTKGAVLAVLVMSFFVPRVVPGRQFVVMGLQFVLSIGLLLYLKAQPSRA